MPMRDKPNHINQYISYLHACYEADNREMIINDFLGSKVEYSRVLDGEDELLNGHLPYLPVDEKWASKVEKELQLYHREKNLLVGAFPIVGNVTGFQGRTNRFCAPLLIYPAAIVREGEEDLPYLKVHLDRCRINYPALQVVVRETESVGKLDDELVQHFPKGKMDFGRLGKLARLIKQMGISIEVEDLLFYPRLLSGKTLKKQLQPKVLEQLEGFAINSALMAGVVRRSSETEGVLGELKALKKVGKGNELLAHLLGQEEVPLSPLVKAEGFVPQPPTLLNTAQTQAAALPYTLPLGVVVGPPGTGKSYTIASLAAGLVAEGKTVLVASRNDEAVTVVGNKFANDLGLNNLFFRAGKREWFEEMDKFAEAVKDRLRTINTEQFEDSLFEQEKRIALLTLRIEQEKKRFTEVADIEQEWSKQLLKMRFQPAVLKILRKKFERFSKRNTDLHWKSIQKIERNTKQLLNASRKYIETNYWYRNKKEYAQRRMNLNRYMKAIRSRTSEGQQRRFAKINWDLLLELLPVWGVKISDVHKVLPFDNQLFDVVIVDEASQCDAASIVPLLFRAKTVILCGDPMQLNHLSFLSTARQKTFAQQFLPADNVLDAPNFRRDSILDIALDRLQHNEQMVHLHEHFRSVPSIIEFSNVNIYRDKLVMMTERPNHAEWKGNHLFRVKGSRDSTGINQVEINAIVDHLRALVDVEYTLKPKVFTSVGILSPFRKQVDSLAKRISSEFNLNEIRRHKMMVGTAFSFQGEERDSMFLSLVVDNSTGGSALRHLNKPNVFNVSITRARTQQFVYSSVDTHLLPPKGLLRPYLEFIVGSTTPMLVENDFKHAFADDVTAALEKEGISTSVNYFIAGKSIDLVAYKGTEVIGIDLIGFPGKFEQALPFERYQLNRRAGLITFPLPFTYWLVNTASCVEQIKTLFK